MHEAISVVQALSLQVLQSRHDVYQVSDYSARRRDRTSVLVRMPSASDLAVLNAYHAGFRLVDLRALVFVLE